MKGSVIDSKLWPPASEAKAMSSTATFPRRSRGFGSLRGEANARSKWEGSIVLRGRATLAGREPPARWRFGDANAAQRTKSRYHHAPRRDRGRIRPRPRRGPEAPA